MIRGGGRIGDAAAAAGAQTLADAAVAPSSATSAPHPQLLPENPAYVSRTHWDVKLQSARRKKGEMRSGGIYLSNDQLGPNGQNIPGKNS